MVESQRRGGSQEVNRLFERFPLHPLYFGLFPPLVFYAIFGMLQMQPDVLTIPILVCLTGTLALYGILALVLRNAEKAAIITTIVSAMFFTLTYIFLLDKALGIVNAAELLRASMIPVFAVFWGLLIAACAFVTVTRKPLTLATRILNEAGLYLCLLEILVVAAHAGQVSFLWMPSVERIYDSQDNVQYRKARAGAARLSAAQSKPDVYFILLDEFASRQVLKRFFDYDNEEFLDLLRARGFVVARDSHSNYPRTMLTLASMMNMTHLDELATLCGADTTDWSVLVEVIRDSRIARLFKEAGYRTVMFGSGAAPTDWNPAVDENHPCTMINWFAMKLMQASLPGLLPGSHEFFNEQTRRQRLCTFEGLKKMPRERGPKFVFAHFLLPHEPFIFGPGGEAVDIPEEVVGETWHPKTRRGFKDQTIFLEKAILATVDEIIRKSEVRPVIIIQGDHGPNSTGSITTPTPNDNVLVERYGVLSAYLVPEPVRASIYDTITPINIFRILSNHLFGSAFDLARDRIYYTPYPYPYRFQDVTEKVIRLQAEGERSD